MSSSSTRCRSAICLDIWVQFLPCPNSPWQNTTHDPASPCVVAYRPELTGLRLLKPSLVDPSLGGRAGRAPASPRRDPVTGPAARRLTGLVTVAARPPRPA